ncbi:uncharacterized protein TrAtP1_002277 [Trichoderma atroviride]|uniref:uncharacterized protein n=1 Tax=Hypocrea atroviridis TaxID=63577 RepID=UPI0033265165|nr:hypothetical protein TrAtP1_002277 [Trichoderma atroviride]
MFARPKSDSDVNTTTNIDVPTTAVAQQNREPRRYQGSARRMEPSTPYFDASIDEQFGY